MIYFWIGLAALFVLIGWGIHRKKWYFLISGYNMMSKEDQAEVDIEPLAKSLAVMSYIVAGLLLLMGLTIQFELFTLTMIITGVMIVVPLIFVLKGQKYYKGVSAKGANPKSGKISVIITVATLVVVGVVIYFADRPTTFEMTNSGLSISGMYGDDYAWESIETVDMLTELPEIAARTNGSAVGSSLKGNFKFKNGEKAVLFLDKSVPPFIRIEVDDKIIIFNESDADKTRKMFKQMQQYVN